MTNVEKNLCMLLKEKTGVVMATVLNSMGSTPRSSGARMLIKSDGSIVGTIGGGKLEAAVIREAKPLFVAKDAVIIPFDLSTADAASSVGMICGGKMDVLMEYLPPAQETIDVFEKFCVQKNTGVSCFLLSEIGNAAGGYFPPLKRKLVYSKYKTEDTDILPSGFLEKHSELIYTLKQPALIFHDNRRFLLEPTPVSEMVYVLGAGHVGLSVAFFSKAAGFDTVVMDDRDEFANRQRFPTADEVIVLKSFEDAFAGLRIDPESYVVILTRGHLHDKTVLAQALKTPAKYIGMIGSRKKRDQIYAQLKFQGFTESDIARVHSPIGISINAETPEEIAVAIVAELIAVKRSAKSCGSAL